MWHSDARVCPSFLVTKLEHNWEVAFPPSLITSSRWMTLGVLGCIVLSSCQILSINELDSVQRLCKVSWRDIHLQIFLKSVCGKKTSLFDQPPRCPEFFLRTDRSCGPCSLVVRCHTSFSYVTTSTTGKKTDAHKWLTEYWAFPNERTSGKLSLADNRRHTLFRLTPEQKGKQPVRKRAACAGWNLWKAQQRWIGPRPLKG